MSRLSPNHRASSRKSDDAYLRELGYEPVLTRRMGPFGNFAISFSVISVLSGCMTLYGFGLNTGGPAVMLWGWLIVGAMVMLAGAGNLLYWYMAGKREWEARMSSEQNISNAYVAYLNAMANKSHTS